MNQGGLIIRLIDVVLIILLGFLNISDFVLKTQIKLDSGKSIATGRVITRIYNVLVLDEGNYQVEDVQNKKILMFAPPRENALQELEFYLSNELNQNLAQKTKMLVVLRSAENTKIQYTIDVLDICEKHKIPRSISY